MLGIEGPKNNVAELELSRRFSVLLVWDSVRVRAGPAAVGRREGDAESDEVREVFRRDTGQAEFRTLGW